jgi:hypothetical protein
MSKRIIKPSRKGGKWGHYLKKGLELGALGAVQFVPGLDVAADAAVAGEAAEGAMVAGEAAEGAEAVEAGTAAARKAANKGGSRFKKFFKDQANQYVDNKIADVQQQAQDYVSNRISSYTQRSLGYRQPQPQVASYRQPYYPPQIPEYRQPYQPQMPSQMGAGYREPYPTPKKPLLGPLEKKILIYGAIFVVLCIIVLIVIRTVSHVSSGYSHSMSGSHCKKNNHCGSGKKHRCNGGSGSGNSGHNSCGGS